MRDSIPEKPEEIDVKLKPLLGLPPTTYLPALYGAALVVIFFLVLVLPGLVKPGTVLTVESTPAHAAVSIDGVVRGAGGEPVFVPAGMRSIVVSKPGYENYAESGETHRRLIGSLFVPRRRSLTVALTPISAELLVETAILNFSGWSLIGEASGQYQFPPVARELGLDLAGSRSSSHYGGFAEIALLHVDSEAQLNDLLAGALLAAAGGAAIGPLSIAAVAQDLAAGGSPGLPVQLAEFLSGRRREIVADSPWAAAGSARLSAIASLPRVAAASLRADTRTYAGLGFLQVPAGSGIVGGSARAERGGDIPYFVDLPGFLVSQTEVTVEAYSRFVTAAPEWSMDNRDELVNKGLVDPDYLRDWSDGMPTATLPVRNVSAYAAEAFTAWFSVQVNDFGLAARLPGEAEWDYLAALDVPPGGVFAATNAPGPSVVGESVRGSLGLFGLAGNVWEWTADPFATYDRYHTGTGVLLPADGSAHRVVRGGGWATLASDFIIDDRGSMPPQWCSGAVGFRIILSEI